MTKREDAGAAWRCIAQMFLGTAMHDRFHEASEAAGVPHPGAMRLLLQLRELDAPSMGEIATALKCDASWVTALVDALEKAGCVKRLQHSADRRVKLVHITPHGLEAKQRASEVLTRPPKSMDRLTAAETKQLARLLRLIADE